MMPDWLTAHLDAEGVMDATTRLTRNAQHRRCPSGCGLLTLAGLEDDWGRPTYTNVLPTTASGEFYAVIRGLRTYTLIGGQLCHRDASRIAYRCADDEPVHAEHSCREDSWMPVNTKFAPKPRPVHVSDEPPF